MAIYWLVFVLFLPFDLIKAGAAQTKTSLLKQYAAGERVDLLDDYDFTARTITDRDLFIILLMYVDMCRSCFVLSDIVLKKKKMLSCCVRGFVVKLC